MEVKSNNVLVTNLSLTFYSLCPMIVDSKIQGKLSDKSIFPDNVKVLELHGTSP